MTRRNLNHKMLDDVDISASRTSDRTNVDGVDQGIIIVQWTGTVPVGVITVEGSNSSDTDFTKGDEIWEELDFGAAINVSGASGSHQLNFSILPFRSFRIIYTRSSGTGNLTAHLNAASIGA